jgi:D-3-phosphoglycerate dehydrogenase / 2-oxoglutarate reductase
MHKVLITTVPFGENNRYPLDLLEQNNIEYLINPLKKKLTENELIGLISDFDIIIAGTEKISRQVIAKGKSLKFISRVGIGLDSIDLLEAENRQIQVSYTPDAPAPAVVELTMGLMYTLLRNVHVANIQLHKGQWKRHLGKRLTECSIGIIGAGRVGSKVIKNLLALGCKNILYHDKNVRLKEEANGSLTFADRDEIYKNTDIVSLHLPLDSETKNLITIKEIELMKKDSFLINTARGGIINENDLSVALEKKLIAGAAIDVFEDEPYNGKLVNHENCILTSHMGSMTIDCRSRMEIEATEEAIRYIKGFKLQGLVPEDEYKIQRNGSNNNE